MTAFHHDAPLHDGTRDQSPEGGMAESIGGLSEQTRLRRQREVVAARSETWGKARSSGPGLALLGVSAALGLGAAASGYRRTMRFLEKFMPPAAAGAAGVILYGLGAGVAAVAAADRLRDLPAPLPTNTIQAANPVQATAEAVGRAARTAASVPNAPVQIAQRGTRRAIRSFGQVRVIREQLN